MNGHLSDFLAPGSRKEGESKKVRRMEAVGGSAERQAQCGTSGYNLLGKKIGGRKGGLPAAEAESRGRDGGERGRNWGKSPIRFPLSFLFSFSAERDPPRSRLLRSRRVALGAAGN